jgi:putative oxidoreductase
MKPLVKLLRTNAPLTVLVIRLLVGGVFLLEGIKKFLFADQWGDGRFARIGIPASHILGPFVGVVEIFCGLLLLAGLLIRIASILLIVDNAVAIASTKIPILLKSGFWPMEAEARTDYSMLMSLVFLLIVGAGTRSLEGWLCSRAGHG